MCMYMCVYLYVYASTPSMFCSQISVGPWGTPRIAGRKQEIRQLFSVKSAPIKNMFQLKLHLLCRQCNSPSLTEDNNND